MNGYVLGRVENIVGKGENSAYPNFSLNSLPNDKIVDWSKLKELAGDKIKVNQKMKLDLEKLENIAGKGENAG